GRDGVFIGVGGAEVDAQTFMRQAQTYYNELRSAGPGNPYPPGEPRLVACNCGEQHDGADATLQDGAADLIGMTVSQIVGHVGADARGNLASGDVGRLILGIVEVAAVAGLSLVNREQNWDAPIGYGGRGGGSDFFDQAGLP